MWRWGVCLVSAFAAFVPMELRADDMPGYSTVMRVEFVLQCMRDHSGSQYELMNKCSCALDQLGKRYTVEQFVESRTMAQAITIAGERGSALRDNAEAHRTARAYREALATAESDCFLRPLDQEERN